MECLGTHKNLVGCLAKTMTFHGPNGRRVILITCDLLKILKKYIFIMILTSVFFLFIIGAFLLLLTFLIILLN